MPKVYRYEYDAVNLDNDQRPNDGPYNTNVYYPIKDRMADKHRSDTHPNIHADFKVRFNYNNYCGCISIKALRKWFKGFNKPLLENNFNLVEYHIKTDKRIIGKSKKQCIFDYRNVTKRIIIK